ncbi:MAG: glucan biosynthesis protein, partial [Candidatus Omnitrophota bacterium]
MPTAEEMRIGQPNEALRRERYSLLLKLYNEARELYSVQGQAQEVKIKSLEKMMAIAAAMQQLIDSEDIRNVIAQLNKIMSTIRPQGQPQTRTTLTHDEFEALPSDDAFNDETWVVHTKPTGYFAYDNPMRVLVWDDASNSYIEKRYQDYQDTGRLTIALRQGDSWPTILALNGAGYVRFSANPPLRMGATLRLGAYQAGLQGQQFPRITEVRLRKINNSQYRVILTLDSDLYSGTVNILLTPGDSTAMNISATYKMKRDLDISREKNTGFIAFASMFGIHPRTSSIVHDSDTLEVVYADGARVTRRLVNPADRVCEDLTRPGTTIASFGLEQRNRNADSFRDRGPAYHQRSSYVISIRSSNIPLGIVLNEDHSETDNSDNIYPVVVPQANLRAGQEITLQYDAVANRGGLAQVEAAQRPVIRPQTQPAQAGAQQRVISIEELTRRVRNLERSIGTYFPATPQMSELERSNRNGLLVAIAKNIKTWSAFVNEDGTFESKDMAIKQRQEANSRALFARDGGVLANVINSIDAILRLDEVGYGKRIGLAEGVEMTMAKDLVENGERSEWVTSGYFNTNGTIRGADATEVQKNKDKLKELFKLSNKLFTGLLEAGIAEADASGIATTLAMHEGWLADWKQSGWLSDDGTLTPAGVRGLTVTMPKIRDSLIASSIDRMDAIGIATTLAMHQDWLTEWKQRGWLRDDGALTPAGVTGLTVTMPKLRDALISARIERSDAVGIATTLALHDDWLKEWKQLGWLRDDGTLTPAGVTGLTVTMPRIRDALVAADIGRVDAIGIATTLAMHENWLNEWKQLGWMQNDNTLTPAGITGLTVTMPKIRDALIAARVDRTEAIGTATTLAMHEDWLAEWKKLGWMRDDNTLTPSGITGLTVTMPRLRDALKVAGIESTDAVGMAIYLLQHKDILDDWTTNRKFLKKNTNGAFEVTAVGRTTFQEAIKIKRAIESAGILSGVEASGIGMALMLEPEYLKRWKEAGLLKEQNGQYTLEERGRQALIIFRKLQPLEQFMRAEPQKRSGVKMAIAIDAVVHPNDWAGTVTIRDANNIDINEENLRRIFLLEKTLAEGDVERLRGDSPSAEGFRMAIAVGAVVNPSDWEGIVGFDAQGNTVINKNNLLKLFELERVLGTSGIAQLTPATSDAEDKLRIKEGRRMAIARDLIQRGRNSEWALFFNSNTGEVTNRADIERIYSIADRLQEEGRKYKIAKLAEESSDAEGLRIAVAKDILQAPHNWSDFFGRDGAIVSERNVRTFFEVCLANDQYIKDYLRSIDTLTGFYTAATEREKMGMVTPVARSLALTVSNVAELREEMALRVEIFKAAKKYGFNLSEDALAYYVTYIRKTINLYGPQFAYNMLEKPDETRRTIDMIFGNIKYVMTVRREAGNALLAELNSSGLQPWETQRERNAIVAAITSDNILLPDGSQLRISEGLRDEPMTFDEAVFLGTRYMMMRGYSTDRQKFFDEVKNEMYLQAVNVIFNNGSRMEKGDVGYWMTYAQNENIDIMTIGKFLKYFAKFKEAEMIMRDEIAAEIRARRTPEVGAEAAAREAEIALQTFPTATSGQINGLIFYMHRRGWGVREFLNLDENGNTVLDERSGTRLGLTFRDYKFMQVEEFSKMNHRLHEWSMLFSLLSQQRGEHHVPLNDRERQREIQRLLSTHRQNVAYQNLNSYDPLAQLYWTWRSDFGDLLTPEEGHDLLQQFGLSHDILGPGQGSMESSDVRLRRNRLNEFIERVSGIRKIFTVYLGQPVFESGSADIHGQLEGSWSRFYNYFTPALRRSIEGNDERRYAIARAEARLSAREVDRAIESYSASIERQRAANRTKYTAILINPNERMTQLAAIKAEAARQGVTINDGDAIYILKKMAEVGYGMREAVMIYAVTPVKVEAVYKEVYQVTDLRANDRYVISSIAETMTKHLAILDLEERAQIEQSIRQARRAYLTKKLGTARADRDAAITAGDSARARIIDEHITFLEQQLANVDNWSIDSHINTALDVMRESFVRARDIQAKFSAVGIEMSGDESRIMAAVSIGGGINPEDMRIWLDTSRLVMELQVREVMLANAQMAGLSNNDAEAISREILELIIKEKFNNSTKKFNDPDKLKSEIKDLLAARGVTNQDAVNTITDRVLSINPAETVYTVDGWLRLGLADTISPRSYGEDTIESTVRTELSGLGINVTPAQLASIVEAMKRKNIPPVVIRLLCERVRMKQRELSEALRREQEKPFDDVTKAPRALYDLSQLAPRDWLTYLDETVSYGVDYRIGFMEIFNYDSDRFETSITRPIGALDRHMVESRLIAEVPQEVQQATWSSIEKLRYKLYGYMRSHKALVAGII